MSAVAPIPGYEGVYSATSDGHVLRHARRWLIGPGRVRTRDESRAPEFLSMNGYLRINLHKDGERRSEFVHRLVALAFLPNPQGLPQVNHLNGDKTDNRPGNLEWCTASYNKQHAVDNGLCRYDSPAFLASVRANAVVAREAKARKKASQ